MGGRSDALPWERPPERLRYTPLPVALHACSQTGMPLDGAPGEWPWGFGAGKWGAGVPELRFWEDFVYPAWHP